MKEQESDGKEGMGNRREEEEKKERGEILGKE